MNFTPVLLLLAAAAMLPACASKPDAAAVAASTAPASPIAGGYAPADEKTPGLIEARTLVTKQIYASYPTRARIESITAETQVVAGMNYRFHVVMTGSPELRNEFDAVVYKDLDGKMTVSSLDRTNPK